MRLVLITAFTLFAFAANSLLTRMALDGGVIDPVSFTALRLSSGTLVLLPLSQMVVESKSLPKAKGSWGSGLALFAYAGAFSLAYVSLSTGMGALILFGAVQVTMLTAALKSGDRLGAAQWVGTVTAVAGLVYLVLPGLTAPDPLGAVLMGTAGIAWGVYSLRGRGASAPVAMTAGNFLRSAPLALIVSGIAFSSRHLEPLGILLALTSGMITSGLGYVLWYKALKALTTTQASLVQLLVPVLAAFGGVLFLAEQISFRLILASTLILGGVALAVVKRGHVAGSSLEKSRF
jgi:drug/metabolite transporter (DMT)-like permease